MIKFGSSSSSSQLCHWQRRRRRRRRLSGAAFMLEGVSCWSFLFFLATTMAAPAPPTLSPTSAPTSAPTLAPSRLPTLSPTLAPSSLPTLPPTKAPSLLPTLPPTLAPSSLPTLSPTFMPSISTLPTPVPTLEPSPLPTTPRPTPLPTLLPTVSPLPTRFADGPNAKYTDDGMWTPSGIGPQGGSHYPSPLPTLVPTPLPTLNPSKMPTSPPTLLPSPLPTLQPTSEPTGVPSGVPSLMPTAVPTGIPSSVPTGEPTGIPSSVPTGIPSGQPTSSPTGEPTGVPSSAPTGIPSGAPTGEPTGVPSSAPTGIPSGAPTGEPTGIPSSAPTGIPTLEPTLEPTGIPSSAPTGIPSGAPTGIPSGAPTAEPSLDPTALPSLEPSGEPTGVPTGEPTALPTLAPTGEPTGVPTGEPTPMPTPETSDDTFEKPYTNVSFFPGLARIPVDINIVMKIWGKPQVGDTVVITLPWFTSSGCDPTVKGKDLDATDFVIWDNTRNSINFDNKYGNSSNTPGWSAEWIEGDVTREFSNSKLLLKPTRTIPWRQMQYLTIDAETNLMTCVGVPLKVSSNEVIPEYSEKHNFTIHGFFQNLSTWYHDHDWAQYGGIGTTYIKNGKYIYRKIPRRQTLPVMTAINGSGHLVNTKITFGTDASPIFKFGTNDMTGLGNRIEVDGSEIIFRLTPGMNLLPGDNITFMLPGFSNSPNPFSFRDDGYDIHGKVTYETWIFDPENNRTKNHKYDLTNMYGIARDTRAKATYREGYTPNVDGGLKNLDEDGTPNFHDLRLNSSITFTLNVSWAAGKELAIGVHRKNNISATCFNFRDDSRFLVKVETQLNWTSVPWQRVESVQEMGIGLGCDNNCGGHGTCKVGRNCQLYCECHEGYGFPYNGQYDGNSLLGGEYGRQDCSKRTCPADVSFATLAQYAPHNKTHSWEAHYKKECSDAGICNRDSGQCECFPGFSGKACEYRTCLGIDNECSGHGRCLPMQILAMQDTALPLSDTNHDNKVYYEIAREDDAWDARVVSGCLCDSSWKVGLDDGETQEPEYFGPDCSLRRCPSNYDPLSPGNETDCSGVLAAGGRGTGKPGNKCHIDCSNRGSCDYSTGTCECFPGFRGVDCHDTARDDKVGHRSSNELEAKQYRTERSNQKAGAEAASEALSYATASIIYTLD